MTKISDEDLVSAYVKTQKSVYFDTLYQRYVKKILGKSLSMLNSLEEAEDAVHDIFMKVLMKISKYDNRSKFSTWLYSITYNHCIDIIRKNKKRKTVLEEEVLPDVQEADDAQEKFILEIKVDRLDVILDKISKEEKALLLMKYLEEMKIKEIASITRYTESAVKMKLKRAKHKLQRIYYQTYND